MAKNRSRYAILGALTIRPMSGYDIRQFFAKSVSHFWDESYGQIYPILKGLHSEGLVSPVKRGRGSSSSLHLCTTARLPTRRSISAIASTTWKGYAPFRSSRSGIGLE